MSAALLGTGVHAMELHNQVLGKELPGREQPYKKSLDPMVRGIAAAWKLYDRPGSVFLFLGEPLPISADDAVHIAVLEASSQQSTAQPLHWSIQVPR